MIHLAGSFELMLSVSMLNFRSQLRFHRLPWLFDAAGVSGGDQDQGTSSSGCKVDNYVHLGRVGFGGVSCGNDVSTQTEESHESAETLLELGSFLHDELEKYLEKMKKK